MIIKKCLILMFPIVGLVACQETKEKPRKEAILASKKAVRATEEKDSSAISERKKPVIEEKDSVVLQKTKIDLKPDDMYYLPNGTFTGVYEDATMYAGSTDFKFIIDGVLKFIRVDNMTYFDLQDGKKVKGYELPTDLLDPSDEVEGPPGGNPVWVGKKFTIKKSEGQLSIQPQK